jgi:hypothetical protein
MSWRMLSLQSMLLLLLPLLFVCSVLKLCRFQEEAQPKSVRSAWRSRQGQLQLQASTSSGKHPAASVDMHAQETAQGNLQMPVKRWKALSQPTQLEQPSC